MDPEILDSILKYCDDRNCSETLKELILTEKYERKKEPNLEKLFETFFQKGFPEKHNKLSFTFKVGKRRSLLKERLSKMNVIEPKSASRTQKRKKAEKEQKENEVPESFLKLLDQLCLDRKNARKLFENPDEWTYVKSDRTIFCAQIGLFVIYSLIFFNCRIFSIET